MLRFCNLFLIFYTIVIFFTAGNIEAQIGQLPKDEVEVLKEIATELGKKDWDFKQNPCDGNSNWSTPKRKDMPLYNNTLVCNCTFPDGLCHVQSIFLKGQDLAGVLPASLAKLPYLKKIDFNRNYLSGTIPPEWASTKLEFMVVSNNRLSGPIPEYIGNMTSLTIMSLETNLFNGSLPVEVGNLVNLQNLVLSANNFTGEWPVELNDLTKLIELRMSSNSFVGKLPNFKSWKNLQMLEIQGSGFEGPIPPSISNLTSLTELRISDLKGGASEFPPLRNMTGMTKLVLRSCNIDGKIPDFVADMSELRFIDLSFNKLEGGIANIESLTNLEATYLTGNAFVGPIPEWLKSRDTRYVIDLSYNKFDESSEPSTCRDNLNLFRSFKGGNFVEQGKCLSMNPCSEDKYSLHINCGGGKVIIGNTTYEADEDSAGAAKFVYWKGNWGASSTGHFWDRIISLNDYKADNVSAIKGNESQLYMTAHLSPLSLTYFARCLANGSYTLTLHFAEIVYRDNRSFQSLGRRIFDVYIQDELKFKDFDIERVAGGVDKALKEKFNVTVKDKTLDIRFQYAGKGTTSIPSRGSYGPLVSAISLEANFKPPPTLGNSSNRKKKILIVVGAVMSSLALILMILFVAWRKRRNRKLMEQELRGLDLQTGIFTFRQIKAATNNFDAANKLGEGGFGSVYKGTLADGTIIAVKQLSSKSRQGNREFVNEIGMMSGLRHPNLVRLYGCCVERNQLLLVYEYMENNCLSHVLFGPEECPPKLDWPTRQKICVGIAKGLFYLHEESPLKIVHRDIKGTNVLLDKDLNAKISDFGLAKLHDDEKTHITTRVAGTIGYMAPEYALWGYLTYKADLYSFGVVILELVAGKNNMKYNPDENYVCLLDWALVLQRKGKFLELVDPRLGSNYNKKEALRMIKVALLCTNPSPALRPNMSTVVKMLEGRLDVNESNIDSSAYDDEFNFQGLRDKYDEMQVNSSENQSLFRSIDTKETERSSSTFTSTSTSEF
ncbi:PREDICTED: probable LRR receptor-like serine/threonine-protein kinase At1g07650 isoform X1 [Nicotiana attenuata]|uniref:non-specific serine/threonine protein kinase n=1 Tax=Nicotiana attenuata TaxID=49451 RepID=A0A314L029_NICAT|nr:PREDICTED: probable LRR receptor-like serine/threonine-protein kinase At1g07650 isoform X1 [Nicotiana attenuata]OIT34832.1 putative lrr receptor-like serinethreonine-protein kinase [Nicotiana attenuata]